MWKRQSIRLILAVVLVVGFVGFMMLKGQEQEVEQEVETEWSGAPPSQDEVWILADGVVDSFPPNDKARTFYLHGVKVGSEYFWYCDGEWKEIEPPCK